MFLRFYAEGREKKGCNQTSKSFLDLLTRDSLFLFYFFIYLIFIFKKRRHELFHLGLKRILAWAEISTL